jgi:hypothetical protein
MRLTEFILRPKLSEDDLLLPVGIIKSAAFILAEGSADEVIAYRLHGIAFGNLIQPFIFINQ